MTAAPELRPGAVGRFAILEAAGRTPRLFARGLVKVYRYTFSPLVGFHCRHLPTCSDYADEALGRFGLWAGGWMTLARLCRCQPWGTRGLDFVPSALPAKSHWLLPWRFGRWRSANAGLAEPPLTKPVGASPEDDQSPA